MKRLDMIHELEKELKFSRFVHTMGVAYTATSLAMHYGYDVTKAETAGLLHDCAKYYSAEKMESLCKKGGIPISEAERGNTALLHAKAGRVLAKTQYGIEDKEILDAIQCHTTGRPAMTLLDKILFVSDYIEPGRSQAPNLEEIREMAFDNLDDALCKILYDTLFYLNKSGKLVDPMTKMTYDYYMNLQSYRD